MLQVETQIDVSRFWNLVQNVNGQVTGSIHLQILLGTDQFKSNDLDVFIMEDEHQYQLRPDDFKNYTPLHSFLFEQSTDMISSAGTLLTKTQRKLANRNVKFGIIHVNELRIVEKKYESNCISQNVQTVYQIRNVYTYQMKKRFRKKAPGLKIQVITIRTPKMRPIVQGTEDCKTFIASYIQSRFDFTISMSMYDGEIYKICNVLDIYNRFLTLTDEYQSRVTLFNDVQEISHKRRIAKYEQRNFRLFHKLVYGENLKFLRNDEGNSNYHEIKILNLHDFIDSCQSNKCQRLH